MYRLFMGIVDTDTKRCVVTVHRKDRDPAEYVKMRRGVTWFKLFKCLFELRSLQCVVFCLF